MRFKDLIFHEISDEKTQASLTLDCNYQIQITFDRKERCFDAKLWDEKDSLVDAEEGLDEDGVEQFVESSEDLVELYKEGMVDAAMVEYAF
jgi:hypothetical protein